MKTYFGEIYIKYRETKPIKFCLFSFILLGNGTTHFLDMFMLIKLATVHLVSMRPRCFRISEKPEVHPIISLRKRKEKKRKKKKEKEKVKKKLQKCNPPDFKFYLGKLTNTKFHITYGVMLIFGLQKTIQKRTQS